MKCCKANKAAPAAPTEADSVGVAIPINIDPSTDKIKNMGDGKYQVVNSAFSNCMDIHGSINEKFKNWRKPMTWKCYNVKQQRFIFEAER